MLGEHIDDCDKDYGRIRKPVVSICIWKGIGKRGGGYSVFLDADTFFRYETCRDGITQRNFQLNELKTTLPILDMEHHSWRKYFYPYARNFKEYLMTGILSFLSRRVKIPRKIYSLERIYLYQEKYMNYRKECYISGYFQSPGYFSSIREILLEEFQLKYESTPAYLKMKKRIDGKESIAIHVRRGDYVDAGVNLPWEYYRKAMGYMEEKLTKPVYYIFSDEISWVKEKLGTDVNVVYVNEARNMTDCEELSLMRQCRHFIISNSSFSWWGAWLGTYQGKIVVAPNRWTQGNEIRDVILQEWIKIEYD